MWLEVRSISFITEGFSLPRIFLESIYSIYIFLLHTFQFRVVIISTFCASWRMNDVQHLFMCLLAIMHHPRNANQNRSEMSPHTFRKAFNEKKQRKKDKQPQVLVGTGGRVALVQGRGARPGQSLWSAGRRVAGRPRGAATGARKPTSENLWKGNETAPGRIGHERSAAEAWQRGQRSARTAAAATPQSPSDGKQQPAEAPRGQTLVASCRPARSRVRVTVNQARPRTRPIATRASGKSDSGGDTGSGRGSSRPEPRRPRCSASARRAPPAAQLHGGTSSPPRRPAVSVLGN